MGIEYCLGHLPRQPGWVAAGGPKGNQPTVFSAVFRCNEFPPEPSSPRQHHVKFPSKATVSQKYLWSEDVVGAR